MRVSLCVFALLLTLTFVSAFPFRPSRHVGVLNQRLTRDELSMQSLGDIEPQWLNQKLDHQDLTSTITWQQKYYVNDTWYQPGGPVFFVLGGEGPVSPHYVTDHFYTAVLAAEHNALLVAMEHRFYGVSYPQNNESVVYSLKYLSSSQNLADYVTFHEQIQSQYSLPPSTKWIVFGGSYSGNLAAWARLKYPHLFAGAFSSSAPLQAKLEFQEYFEVVSKSVGSSCAENIDFSTGEVLNLINNGIQKIVSMFNLCAAPQSPLDIANMLEDLSNPIAGVVQYNDDNNKYQPYDIPVMCSMLTNASDPLVGLQNVFNSYNAFSNQTTCTDVSYKNMIASMQSPSDARSWTWQTCTEFGYFQTGSAKDQPFSNLINLQYFLQQCQDLFGIENMQPNINYTNDYYGGKDIWATNTIFTNGDVDPWHVLGTYNDFSGWTQSTALLIHGTAHCADLYPARASDVPGLTTARNIQSQYLRVWLSDSEKLEDRIQESIKKM